MEYAAAFAQHAQDSGHDTEVVTGFLMEGSLILQGHAATLLDDGYVYDWTVRQFDAEAPVPTVIPLAAWRETWRQL